MTADTIIKELDLKVHPEGGYYRETYRSTGALELSGYEGIRSFSTGIYYLLLQGKISAFHKIKQDEMWHFYKGSSLELHIISPDGSYQKVIVGNQLNYGEVPQFVVHGGDYFAARVCSGGHYSLAGCTVAPGFDFKDFVMPSRSELIQQFPKHEAIIRELTHS
ncbi:cupin domain-containing protein [Winogradskyella aurantiaca]|uniref:cupin domain-containing protein n=1 Tax=Winogradskyella aurantiaca TaxID=2219558 RepID=UPI000E1D01BE|nr:cupin domain-containing protein [Winogradskyella aurantiaca]